MVCPKPSVSLGVFICLFGHLFGSSGCAADLSTQWRGQLLAAALRFGLSGLEEPSVDQLEDRLRRSLAVCIGVSASSIVRLRIVDLMTGTSGFGEVREFDLEVELEVSLSDDVNETEVLAAIMDLEDMSSPLALLLRDILQGYFQIRVRWVEVSMEPVVYSGSLVNLTGPGLLAGDSDVSLGDSDPDGHTTVASGVVLSMALLPIGAAWIRLVMAEQAAGEHEGHLSCEEIQRSSRPKRRLKSRAAITQSQAADSG